MECCQNAELTVERSALTPRLATRADNGSLIELAAACSMRADFSICMHRSPDFFALNRLEGDQWEVATLDAPGHGVYGCVAMARRSVWIDRRPVESVYVSDLKVHPLHRGIGAADALQLYAWDWCRGIRPDVPGLITILGGNRSMDRRISAMRNMPPLTDVGTVRVHTIPLLRRRSLLPGFPRVSRARTEDLAGMADLWARVSSGRQFAPWFDAAGLARWIAAAPGLRVEDYLVARDGAGRTVGFLALWDQHSFKQLHVVGLSRRGMIFRGLFNSWAHRCGARRLPRPGQAFRCLAALHVCVPVDRLDVLRRLLLAASNEAHGSYSFITIGLDVRDPLVAALGGFCSIPADISLYATSPDGRFRGPRQRSLPLHFETALV